MNLIIYIILFLFGFISLISAENSTDVEVSGRIVGGVAVDISNRKYQVVVLPGDYICGGSLIKYRWILTAAHCIIGYKPSQVRIRAGSNYWYKNGCYGTGQILIRHKRYNGNTMNLDIALVKTRGSFKTFANKYSINIIPLLKKLPKDGALMTVSGYGSISSGGALAKRLKKVTVKKINYSKCNTMYGGDLTSSMFCAAAKGKDSCQGDSGGPITYNGYLAGVVSWGNGCADPSYPGIYTSVPLNFDWIKRKIKM